MFLFWGTKEVKKKLGYVADYCLVCGDIRRHELLRVSYRSHIYYLPYGREKDIHHFITCAECASRLLTDENKYKNIEKKESNAHLDVIIYNTHPNIRKLYRDRIELQRKIRLHPKELDKEIRLALIREPFEVFEGELLAFKAQTQIDSVAFISLLFSLALPIVIFKVLEVFHVDSDVMAYSLIASIVLGIVIISIQMRMVLRRHIVKNIYPKLALSLKKYSNLDQEIDEVFHMLKSENFIVSRKGDLGHLKTLIGR